MEGQTISHYRVLEKLGGGGMGVVYKALDTHLDRHVALKFLPPELTRDDDARVRFTREAQAASALDHPNICTVYDIDSSPDGQLFIAMAYYEGETLKKRIEHGPLPIDEALDIAAQVAQGLSKAHDDGIVHRDIKPANLMLTKDGFVKIVDFGIAKLMGVTGPTQTGTTLGTVSYMSPEQISGDDADQQSDVWSLGAVLYEMLTGEQPFKGENQWAVMNAISNQDPEAPSILREKLPPEIERLVLTALKKPKDSRYASADEFLTRAKGCSAQLTHSVQTPVTSSLSSIFLTPKVAAIALLLVLSAGLSAFWLASRSRNVATSTEQTMSEIRRLIDEGDYPSAFVLARQVDPLLGGGMSRALLKLSGSLVHDYATISDDSPSPNRASRARRAATSAGMS